ncbi:MAG: ATP-grasp fold amidoligase family protein [Hyphomicrobiales bacterium]
MYLGLRHRIATGRWPCFSNPTSFNEHILSRILSKKDSELRSMVCDKIAVRDYVETHVGPNHLSTIHAVWDGTGPLPIEDLPDRFVVKPSHASGEIKIVWDKSKLQLDDLLTTCRKWLKIDYTRAAREYIYQHVPRQIIFEELLIDSKTGRVPYDYKIYVFHGVARVINVHIDRFDDYGVVYFDRNWNHLPGRLKDHVDGPSMPAPKNLQLMLELSSKLSGGLDFIRVDLYDLRDRVVFGELTSFPEGGNQHQTEKFDAYLGHLLNSKIDAETDAPFTP